MSRTLRYTSTDEYANRIKKARRLLRAFFDYR